MAARATEPTRARQLRCLSGTPRRIRKARTGAPAANFQLEGEPAPRTAFAALAVCVLTVKTAVATDAEEFSATCGALQEQEGRTVAPAGNAVSVHARLTVPVYPLVLVTVTVDEAVEPALTLTAVAASMYVDCVTDTEPLPVAAA